MEFDELPPEIIIKIFSHLPQRFLEVLAQVSQSWRKLTCDPSLYTVVCIDPGNGDSPQQTRKILERSTMMRTLEITSDRADFETIASASSALRVLKKLVICSSAISHRAMPRILGHCKSLTAIMLVGPHRLSATDVRLLETLPCLKEFVASTAVGINDDALYQLCCNCPGLEFMEIGVEHISRSESLEYLGFLHYLRKLSVDAISTACLLHVSKSCPGLTALETGFLLNENDISVAQALEGFLELRSLRVTLDCGEGWLNGQFRAPPLLQCFKVPSLVLEEGQFKQLILSYSKTLEHVHIDVGVVPDELLGSLSLCKKVQSLHLSGLKGNTVVFSILCQLPCLTRASLHFVADHVSAVYQLTSIVDTLDKSPRGRTRLVLEVFPLSHDAQAKVIRAARAFADYLILNTSMHKQHILEFAEQYSRSGEAFELTWKVQTTFPTTSPTLKYLILDLDGV